MLIEDWLESLKTGWSRFAIAFAETGVEDDSDLPLVGPDEWEALEASLRAHGAKLVQIKRIRYNMPALKDAPTLQESSGRNTAFAKTHALDAYGSPGKPPEDPYFSATQTLKPLGRHPGAVSLDRMKNSAMGTRHQAVPWHAPVWA